MKLEVNKIYIALDKKYPGRYSLRKIIKIFDLTNEIQYEYINAEGYGNSNERSRNQFKKECVPCNKFFIRLYNIDNKLFKFLFSKEQVHNTDKYI